MKTLWIFPGKKKRFTFLALTWAALFILMGANPVASENKLAHVEEVSLSDDFSATGADSCLTCHDDSSVFPVMGIFKTPHAAVADKHSPFAGKQCEACHGPGAEHAKRVRRNQERAPILGFSRDSSGTAEQRNGQCLACHKGAHFAEWQGSVHNQHALSCSDCHQLHTGKDPVLTRETQAGVCYSCHSAQRADANKYSHHPVREGQLSCSDCHRMHSSHNRASITRNTLNQLCYDCHAEKRGPFLWEHAPVTEDCSYCHQAHGSNNPALLSRRSPLLCQQCHARQDHSGQAFTASNLSAGRGQSFMLAGSCQNCHSRVHGSNHPSGTALSR